MRYTLFPRGALSTALLFLTATVPAASGVEPRAATRTAWENHFSVIGESVPSDDQEDRQQGDQEDAPDGVSLRNERWSEPVEDAGVGDGKESPRPPAQWDATTEAEATEAPAEFPITETPAQTLSPRMAALRDKLRATLGFYHKKRLNTRDHNPWEVMHSIVAYGASSNLNRNGPDGPPVNAISWLCWNGACHGTQILEVTGGRVAARKGPQVQGHPGQFLAILAQSSIATNCPIKVGDQHFTLDDLIDAEMLGCQAGTELTFKLIALSYYLDIDARWKNSAKQDWSIERLVREELSQPIIGAACGGSHRLMGFAYAVRKREQSGLPVTGDFRRAKKYLDEYHRYTLTKLHNSDGSFSTEWFKGPGARPDLGRRIQTSGHILEWLSYSLSEEMLQTPPVVQSVEYLTNVLYDNKDRGWDVGPLGHALHSLAIYDGRVFKPLDAVDGLADYGDELFEEATPVVPLPKPARAKAAKKPSMSAPRTNPRVTHREPRPPAKAAPQRSSRQRH